MRVMNSRLRIKKIYIVGGSIVHKANTRRQIDPTPNLLSYLKTSVYMLSIFIPQWMDCYANLTMPYVFPLTQFHCEDCQIESIYPPISVR